MGWRYWNARVAKAAVVRGGEKVGEFAHGCLLKKNLFTVTAKAMGACAPQSP